MQSRQLFVEIVVSGGHAGDRLAAAVQLLQTVETLAQQVLQRRDRIGRTSLRDVEDHRLCPVERVGDVVRKVVGHLRDLLRDPDETAQERVLFDDRRVTLRGRDGRGVGLQRDEGRAPTDVVEHASTSKLLRHRHDVHGLTLRVQPADRGEDL